MILALPLKIVELRDSKRIVRKTMLALGVPLNSTFRKEQVVQVIDKWCSRHDHASNTCHMTLTKSLCMPISTPKCKHQSMLTETKTSHPNRKRLGP